MAKDPAFLFYPGDWLGGTMGMTFEQKGAYFELLLFQFNNGRFTEAQAKQVLSICDASVWHMVKQKFSTDGVKFWSARLETEIDKRKKFSESRRNNAKGPKTKEKPKEKGEAYAKHMENENRNENEDEILNEYENWTLQIIDGSDQFFEQMFMREMIPAGDHIQHWILDHRDLLNRYPKMRPPTQDAFRKSCIKHIRENYKKPINGTSKTKRESNTDSLKEALANDIRAEFGGR